MPAERWWKFLGPGATAPFSGVRWPTPSSRGPGGWLESADPPDPSRRGLHLCRDRDLPYWIGEELYVVEAEGPVVEGRSFVVASRARLLRRVDAWSREAAVGFALGCVEATCALVADVLRRTPAVEADLLGYTADLERFAAAVAEEPAWASRAGTVALVAATAAARASESQGGWEAERVRQAAWLTDEVLDPA